MDLGIAGRTALVTAASRGLGLGIARALAAEGARVAISSRSEAGVRAAAREIGAVPLVQDAADLDAAPALVRAVEEALGPIDILVTNTGGPPIGDDPLGFTREQWEAAFRTLVLAPLGLIERVVPGMRARRWGRVLNVSSAAAREPPPELVLSSVNRSGMLAAFRSLARTVAADGVTVNSILPGRILTDRVVELSGSREVAERSAAALPAGRLGTVEELAAAAAFLCSAPASYVTGVALLVDGGMTHAT